MNLPGCLRRIYACWVWTIRSLHVQSSRHCPRSVGIAQAFVAHFDQLADDTIEQVGVVSEERFYWWCGGAGSVM
jgi:hypothetical protein